MLTKKYYNELAVMIAESRDLQEFTERLMFFLKVDNPRFDEKKFLAALC